MLKVEEPYLSRSQAFMFALFSGVQGNGSSEGRGGAAVGHGTFDDYHGWHLLTVS